MAAEFIVAGRRDLPDRTGPWRFHIKEREGSVSLEELSPEGQTVAESVAQIVGWTPKTIVLVRKAWELAQVVAEELATALDGAVFCDVDAVVFFDARAAPPPATSMAVLQAQLLHAFQHPQPFFERWAKQEQAQVEAEQRSDPAVGKANDWSDLD